MSKSRDKEADTARAAFKFSLIKTVNADPQMKPNDLKLICAMAEFMTWPKREVWLVTALARAMTGLSESEVSRSRSRLQKRGYVSEPRRRGRTNVYTVENPHLEAIRDHVAIHTEWHRERCADRVAKYRQKPKITPPQSVTETTQSHQPRECYITPPESVYSVHTVEGRASRDAPTSQGRALQPPPLCAGQKGVFYEPHGVPPKDLGHPTRKPDPENSYLRAKEGMIDALGCRDGRHVPFPVPGSEEELQDMLSTFRGLPSPVIGYFRQELMAGQLTPAMVEEQRRFAS